MSFLDGHQEPIIYRNPGQSAGHSIEDGKQSPGSFDSSKPSTKYSPILGGCLRRSSTHRTANYPSGGPGSATSSTPTNTPNSSPGKSAKKLKKITSVWSTIKKFSPVHKLKHHHWNRRRKLLENGGRLCESHPDISCSNLAGLTQSRARMSRDDMDLIPMSSDKHFNIGALEPTGSTSAFVHNTDSSLFGKGLKKISLITSEVTVAKKLRPQLWDSVVNIVLVEGKDLAAKDENGLSDPYVKFKLGHEKYKSKVIQKTLNPVWNEQFDLHTFPDQSKLIEINVFDKDFCGRDDFMGRCTIDLNEIKKEETHQIWKELEDGEGSILLLLTVSGTLGFETISDLDSNIDEKHHFGKGVRNIAHISGETPKKLKTQTWDSVVNIVLVEGKDLAAKDENGFSDPYVKFKLGNEKYKSKVIQKTLNPIWNEQFDLHTFPEQSKLLELQVYDKDFYGKDDFMGKCSINLNDIKKEETLKIWKDLEEGEGSVLLVLTISGTLGSEAISDLETYVNVPNAETNLTSKYSFKKSFTDMDDVGHLIVKIYKAEGLMAADFGGRSDPFCVVTLVNARLQTNTEYKTLSPEWNKIFAFKIYDIHEALEVTVYDEDKDKKVEFLGKIAIPLLKVKNGEKRWYALKDKKLMGRAKGHILVELKIFYNPVKACVRTFNPRETRFVQPELKFKRAVFVRNVTRLKSLVMEFVEIAKFVNSCFQWDSVPRSIAALFFFLVITYFFEIFMAPLGLLLIFIKNYAWAYIVNSFNTNIKEEEPDEFYDGSLIIDDDDDEKEGKSEEKKTLKEKFQTVQEVTAMVQNVLGKIASLGERVKNTFDFSVPFLTWLAITGLTLVTLILYFIPLRYLVMAWGINKFTKKLRNPEAMPNNELLDFISRVPDNDEKIMYKECKVLVNQTPTGDSKKSGATSGKKKTA